MRARGASPRLTTGLLVATNCLLGASAASLVTVQNSTVSVPAANIASAGLPGATNLAGSNFLLSAVMPGTFHGGRVSLKNSQQWVQRYNGDPIISQNSASALLLQRDGRIVVCGYSTRPGSGYDFATVCYAADGAALWTNRYDGPSHGDEFSSGLASDTNGNVWVVGESMRFATNSTLRDLLTIKYTSTGVPVWTNRYSSSETNGTHSPALLLDDQGNAYVQYHATYWVGSIGRPVEDGIIKYDPLGNIAWEKRYSASAPYSGEGLHQIGPMTLDHAGNLIVGGESGSPNYSLGSTIVKFAADGTAIWTNYHSSEAIRMYFKALAVDQQGDIIATAETFGSFGGPSYTSYAVMKVGNDGTSWWTNFLDGPLYGGGGVPQTVVDPKGNTFLMGGTPGTYPGHYRILKIDSAGVPLWTNQIADLGVTNSMIGRLATDNAGNLYVTGYAPAPNGNADFVTIKFSDSAQALWTNRFNGPANLRDHAYLLAVSDGGDVYVAGSSEWAASKYEYGIVKYADSLFYTPPKDFTGVDPITVTLTDHLGNSATGTVEVLVVPGSFRFSLVAPATGMTPAGMQLRVEGVPGTNAVVLEASLDAVSWQRISTNAPNAGVAQFLDPSAVSLARRFYRVIQEQ